MTCPHIITEPLSSSLCASRCSPYQDLAFRSSHSCCRVLVGCIFALVLQQVNIPPLQLNTKQLCEREPMVYIQQDEEAPPGRYLQGQLYFQTVQSRPGKCPFPKLEYRKGKYVRGCCCLLSFKLEAA